MALIDGGAPERPGPGSLALNSFTCTYVQVQYMPLDPNEMPWVDGRKKTLKESTMLRCYAVLVKLPLLNNCRALRRKNVLD